MTLILSKEEAHALWIVLSKEYIPHDAEGVIVRALLRRCTEFLKEDDDEVIPNRGVVSVVAEQLRKEAAEKQEAENKEEEGKEE